MYKLFLALIFSFFCLFSPAYAQDSYSKLSKADSLYEAGSYEESEVLFKDLLGEFTSQNDSVGYAKAALGFGATLLESDRYEEALAWMKDLGAQYSESVPLNVRARMISYVGWAQTWNDLYEEALDTFQEGYLVAEESGDEAIRAQISNSLSVVLRSFYRYEESLDYAQKAVEIFSQNGDEYRHALALRNVSEAYLYLGLFEKAEEYSFKSKEIREKLGNPDVISIIYGDLGYLYRTKNEFNKAIYYYKKQLEIKKGLGVASSISSSYHSLAYTYHLLGDYESAIQYYEECLSLEPRKRSSTFAYSVMYLADTYLALGDIPSAKREINRALEIYEELENASSIALTKLRLAEIEMMENRYESALVIAKEVLEYPQISENKDLRKQAQAALGKIYRELGDYQQSLEYFKEAYHIKNSYENYGASSDLIELSKSYRLLRSDSAFVYSELAVDEIERVRGNIFGENIQPSVFKQYVNFYNELALWHAQEGDKQKAFYFAELAKSRTLIDQLSYSNTELVAAIGEKELVETRQKEKALNSLYSQFEQSSDSAEIEDLRLQILTAKTEYDAFLNEQRLLNPRLRKVDTPNIISPLSLNRKLNNETAIIEYAISGNHLLTFLFTQSDFELTITDLSKQGNQSASEYLMRLVKDFRTSIQNIEDKSVLFQSSDELYSVLLRESIADIPEIKNLLIIPTESLSLLPFEALLDGEQYLIENFNIKYLPSATLINYIANPMRDNNRNLFAVAGSGLETPPESLADLQRSNSLTSLPAAIFEVESISQHFENPRVLMNQNVSEAALGNEDLGSYKYIHFATHGITNEEIPSRSALFLSSQEFETDFSEEDGFLMGFEIENMVLNSDMVVLSACNTGFGKVIPGEGILGLQRSFLKAGSSSVVVSLWSVFDRSTATLMSTFYQNINDYEKEEFGLWNSTRRFMGMYNPPMFDFKTRALRDAKLSLIEHPFYNHPVYWAPFVYIGK